MLWDVIGCKKEKTAAMKKATISNFYHQYYNPFNFMQPVSPPAYISNPVAAATPSQLQTNKV